MVCHLLLGSASPADCSEEFDFSHGSVRKRFRLVMHILVGLYEYAWEHFLPSDINIIAIPC
jgi:hypothetical protein